MRHALLAIIASSSIATFASGCGRESASPSSQQQPREAPHADAQQPSAADKAGKPAGGGEGARPASAGGAEPHVLDIAPEMLRDLRITTIRIDPRNGAEAASLLGELRVDERRYAEVGSPIIARTVRLLAAPGDGVKAGDGLAVLHSVELGRARAEYIAAAARLELATRTLDRKRDLANERITPLREVQEAEAQKSSADADVRAAHAALSAFGITPARTETNAGGATPAQAAANAGTRGRNGNSPNSGATAEGRGESADRQREPRAADDSQFVLRAPIAGVVLDRGIATGQMVDPAKPLFRIADLARLWLVVHAFERDAVRLSEGAAARITLPALPGQTFQGRVSFIGREVDATSRTIPVRIELPNADGVLRPGMSASASLPIGATQTTLMVPAAAVQRVNDQWCVFIPRGTEERGASSFTIRPVGRGRDFGNDVEVLSGLRAGDTVVVEGAFLLRAEAEKARGGADHDEH